MRARFQGQCPPPISCPDQSSYDMSSSAIQSITPDYILSSTWGLDPLFHDPGHWFMQTHPKPYPNISDNQSTSCTFWEPDLFLSRTEVQQVKCVMPWVNPAKKNVMIEKGNPWVLKPRPWTPMLPMWDLFNPKHPSFSLEVMGSPDFNRIYCLDRGPPDFTKCSTWDQRNVYPTCKYQCFFFFLLLHGRNCKLS